VTPTPGRVLVPHLIAEVPEGWAALDVVELYGPSGIQVRVTAETAEPGWVTSDLAERHATALSSGPADYEELELSEAPVFGGHTGLRRSARFTDGSTPYRAASLYLVHDEVGYVASVTGPEASASRLRSDLAAVTDGLTLIASPLGPGARLAADGGPASSAASNSARPSRSPRASADWSAVRHQWSTPEPADIADGLGAADTILTVEELTVLAALLDVPRFPTVSPLLLAGRTLDARSAVAEALVASLRARGLIDSTGPLPAVTEPLGSLVEVALFPDLFVELTVCHGDGDGAPSTIHAWCLRPGVSVSIDGDEPATRRIGPAEPGRLVHDVVAAIGAAQGEQDTRLVFRSTWREGAQLVGGELVYRVDGSTIVDDAGGARTSADLVDDLLAHLP